jgi:hypothetical protein
MTIMRGERCASKEQTIENHHHGDDLLRLARQRLLKFHINSSPEL